VLVAAKLLKDKLHPRYVEEGESGIGVGNFGKVRVGNFGKVESETFVSETWILFE